MPNSFHPVSVEVGSPDGFPQGMIGGLIDD